jgi:hypothetical protein
MADLPEMTSYYNQAMDIILPVPVGWTGKVLGPEAFRIFSLPEPAYQDYRATFSVEKMDLNEEAGEGKAEFGKQALEELAAQAKEELKSDMAGFRPLQENTFAGSDGFPTYSLWYRWQDPQTGAAYSQIQALRLTKAGFLYIFNAATLKPLEERYIPVFHYLIRSAQIQG